GAPGGEARDPQGRPPVAPERLARLPHGPRGVPAQARLQEDARAARPPPGGPWQAALRDPEARRDAPPLRLPPRARRRAQELGGPEGAEPRPEGEASRRAGRGPPDRLRRLRGHDPERR